MPCDDVPDGWVLDAQDCDDSRADVHVGAAEWCDGVDNDCDSLVDEEDAVDAVVWYADVDGDGFGDADNTTLACSLPFGFVADAGDCDDFDADVRPTALEICDALDNDCDGLVDDADPDVDLTRAGLWYADVDGDGFGAGVGVSSCAAPSGSVADDTDCDDADAAVNPAAQEICNDVDDDCDTWMDDEDTSLDLSTAGTWYTDGDGDGYGDAGSSAVSCDPPTGTVADATDCDDTDAAVNPAATEICNGVDDDCDTLVDDDDTTLDLGTATSWYADADADGYGDVATAIVQCAAPSGYLTDATDCDDADASINPGEVEVCFDGVDNDCSGVVDDGATCIDVSITSDAVEVDLYALAGSPASVVSVYVTVASGVTVSSASTGTPAMTTGALASGSTVYLDNDGTISGHGGDGACERSGAGEDGGDALEVTVDVELDTSVGGIYAGGGGGGAGDDPTGGGGGAGGGTGCDGGGNASGGVGGHGSRRFSSVPGGDGTNYDGTMGLGGSWGTSPSSGTGGSGGAPGDGNCEQGQGGAGGGWGGGGGGGYACGSGRSPGDGGDAGWAIRVLSGSLTITGGNDTTHIKGWAG